MKSNRSFRTKRALVAIALAIAGGRSVVTRAATVDELQQQIDALRRQVLELQAKEQREGKAKAAENAVQPSDVKAERK